MPACDHLPSFTPGATRDDTSKNTMLITTGDITDRPYTELGVVKVAVKKLTAFNPNPTTDYKNSQTRTRSKESWAVMLSLRSSTQVEQHGFVGR